MLNSISELPTWRKVSERERHEPLGPPPLHQLRISLKRSSLNTLPLKFPVY